MDNQVWASLCNDCSRDPVVLKFRKSEAAQHEAQLLTCANDVGIPVKADEEALIVQHGTAVDNICFSTLICSDLLNIDFRTRLRGKVDLLLIPAWNQDVGTYSALVEATAYDVHCYVALVNASNFGDTRLRSPAKETYNRDIIRLRGGVEDYCVVGEVDVEKLRRFQSAVRSMPEYFKPTPSGYHMADFRKRLPLVEKGG